MRKADSTRWTDLNQVSGYWSWHNMIRRCHDSNSTEYHRYGAKGVSVCNRWRNSFLDFIADMGSRPSEHHSIERNDGQDGYHPGNCRWALPHDQSRNTSQNVWLTFNGETLCVTDWAAKLGMEKECLFRRLRQGWSVEKSLATPPRPTRRNKTTRATNTLTHAGETLTIPQWAERVGLTIKTLNQRFLRGWTVESALTTPAGAKRYAHSHG